ncbi:MAG: hypothetical protein QOD78_1283 [Chloroflexota bacterium]|nr:hypothetical protein [Chloroflexota bacterium]
MTDQRQLDAVLVAFLAEGMDELADRVMDAALDEIGHTEQRRGIGRPRRLPRLSVSPRMAIAAVVAALVVGGMLILLQPSQPSVGNPSPTLDGVPNSQDPAVTRIGPSPSTVVIRPSSWSAAGTLGAPRDQETATLLPDGTVLIVGGMEASSTTIGSSLASAEIYDPASATSTPTGDMTTPRSGHTATLLPDGRVLVVGGYDDWAALASAELYDPASGTWTAAGSLAEGRGFHTATLLSDGQVLVAGGRSNNSSTGHALWSAELYDPSSGSWTTTGDLVKAHTSHSATLLPDGTVLIVGPSYDGYRLAVDATAQAYDPDSGSWSIAGKPNTARGGHTATLLSDATVLVAGGQEFTPVGCCGATGDPQVQAELYHPDDRSWAVTGLMPQPHTWHSASLLPDGTVLLAGGVNGDPDIGAGTIASDRARSLASADRYDPRTRSWSASTAMSQARALHAAVTLPDGRVLVFGGRNKGKTLDSIEIFDPGSGS